jgi:hypothetical protein
MPMNVSVNLIAEQTVPPCGPLSQSGLDLMAPSTARSRRWQPTSFGGCVECASGHLPVQPAYDGACA